VRPRVLIVDDHEAFRTSACALLEAEGFTVVGLAGDGAEALAQVAAHRPDIVLLDIQLPGLDGFAVADLLARVPDPPDVVLISSREAGYRARAGQAPVRGFLNKSELSGETLTTLVG
jgi:DNA-binding NarL/FixJ family response regulator